MGAILFALFAVFLALGIPIGFGLALSSIGAIFHANYPIVVLSQRFFTALDSFPLMAIPLFMLAGSIMGYGGITRRIIDFALSFVGNIRGSLSHVVAISGIIMGGISGSGVADTAALGSIMVPEMKKRGYDVGFSAALVAASGSIALIIPPSIAMIIYGVTTQTSIGDLFVAGIVPGVMIGFGFLAYSYYIAKKYNYPKEGKVSLKGKWNSFKDASWSLAMPFIIIFGIRGGIFTPTEGGAVVSVYCLIISMFVYKEIKLKDLPKIFYEAAVSTATIATIIAATSLFSWLLASQQIPQKITTALLGVTDNRILLLLLINLLLLITGMFLDSGPAIMLLAPILAPIAAKLGVNMVQFGLVMVINLTIGLLTPPVGTAMYVSSNVSGVPILTLSKKLIPFWIIMVTVLLLVTYVPGLTGIFTH
jgi:C4-dicarboxylate transporter DctM subunit